MFPTSIVAGRLLTCQPFFAGSELLSAWLPGYMWLRIGQDMLLSPVTTMLQRWLSGRVLA